MKTIQKNDRVAHIIILSLSMVVFGLVTAMRRVGKIDFGFSFDTHIFPAISASLNSIVALLLVVGLIVIKKKNMLLHKKVMLTAVVFSILFLISYVLYHFSTAEAKYLGDYYVFYYSILASHIVLAGLVLPFILYSVYRGLTGEYVKHKKLTRYVWPIWLYVSVTGVLVYFMIKPYY